MNHQCQIICSVNRQYSNQKNRKNSRIANEYTWWSNISNMESKVQGLFTKWSDVKWCDVMWCDVMWCDVMWCDVMWCDVIWCDVKWVTSPVDMPGGGKSKLLPHTEPSDQHRNSQLCFLPAILSNYLKEGDAKSLNVRTEWWNVNLKIKIWEQIWEEDTISSPIENGERKIFKEDEIQ